MNQVIYYYGGKQFFLLWLYSINVIYGAVIMLLDCCSQQFVDYNKNFVFER